MTEAGIERGDRFIRPGHLDELLPIVRIEDQRLGYDEPQDGVDGCPYDMREPQDGADGCQFDSLKAYAGSGP